MIPIGELPTDKVGSFLFCLVRFVKFSFFRNNNKQRYFLSVVAYTVLGMKKENAETLLRLAAAKETHNILRTRQLHLDARYEGLTSWLEANSKTADKATVSLYFQELKEIAEKYKQLHKEYHEFADWITANLPEHLRPTFPKHDCDLD